MIADHLRATAFLIADGVLPSNEGRGYVLRRIMRRAMRHAELRRRPRALDVEARPALKREMGEAYPELLAAEALIEETLKLEETRFRRTLERPAHARGGFEDLKAGGVFSGKVAFRLYDIYGFPLDLTQDAPSRAASPSISPPSTRRWRSSARRRAATGQAPARRRPKPYGRDPRAGRGERLPRL